MEHYDFAEVWIDDFLHLICTDASEAHTLFSQLKQLIPKIDIKEQYKLPSGEAYQYGVVAPSGGFWSGRDDAGTQWWIIKQLCSQGWEPIGIASDVHGEATRTSFHYQFKHKGTG